MNAMKFRTRFVVFAALLPIFAGLVLPAIAAVMGDGAAADQMFTAARGSE